MWMKDHLVRKAEYIYKTAHAPAISAKQLLLISFQRRDRYRTGDVTVAEFADVWNNPSNEGLHLMVPIQRYVRAQLTHAFDTQGKRREEGWGLRRTCVLAGSS